VAAEADLDFGLLPARALERLEEARILPSLRARAAAEDSRALSEQRLLVITHSPLRTDSSFTRLTQAPSETPDRDLF